MDTADLISGIFLALQDETDGRELVELAREHVRLMNEQPTKWAPLQQTNVQDPFEYTRLIYHFRIHNIEARQREIVDRYIPDRQRYEDDED